MKKIIVLFLWLIFFFFPISANAYNPLEVSNNKFGVHILFTAEVIEAAKLVNTSGGDWGYVTIPIQSSDKDLEKWQNFMNECKRLHLIPLVRLATNGDYFNTKVWEKPNDENTIDFANFLNSLDWPTKNRYVIIYNEVNRGDEWGGSANPKEYATILQYAITTFKSRNPSFFILSSGLDNAASTSDSSMNEYDFIREMNIAVPGIFNQIDGFASHSYPNPGFSADPKINSKMSIFSYKYEKSLIDSLANKSTPVFITETGWSSKDLTDQEISEYFKEAFQTVWSDPTIVAITPFLLNAGTEPFVKFSLTDISGNQSLRYKSIHDYPKVRGKPFVDDVKKILGKEISNFQIPLEDYSSRQSQVTSFKKAVILTIYSWLLNI